MSTDTTPVCPRLKGLGQEGQATPMTPLGWDCNKYYSNIHDILIKYFGMSSLYISHELKSSKLMDCLVRMCPQP